MGDEKGGKRASKKGGGGFKFKNPIEAKIEEMKLKAMIGMGGLAGALVAWKFTKHKFFAWLDRRAMYAKGRRDRAERIRELRQRLSAPLATAALSLKEHLDGLLVAGPTGYYQVAKYVRGEAGVEEAVNNSVYVFATYLFWRFELQSSMQFESVTAEDHWQYAVDHAIDEVSAITSSNDAKFAVWEMAAPPPGAAPGAVRLPFYISDDTKRAIAELVADASYDPTSSAAARAARLPLSFTNFCIKLRERNTTSPDELARWCGPLVAMSRRYAELAAADASKLSALERKELACARLRIKSLSDELADLLFVLGKSPTDEWFKKKRDLKGSMVADMEAKEKEKAAKGGTRHGLALARMQA